MDVNIERQDDVAVVQPHGRLDSNSSPSFEEQLLGIIEAESAVVLDMAGLNYVSSAGLRVLLVAAKKCKAAGCKFAVFGLTPQVRLVFDISGFLALFAVHPSREEALTACL